MNKSIFIVLSILSTRAARAHGWKVAPASPHPAFDRELYAAALEPAACSQQLHYLRKHALLALMFTDASAKFPTGVLLGNQLDLGSYHQCLAIDYEADDDTTIKGKYCLISLDVVDFIHILLRDYNDSKIKRMASFLMERLARANIIMMAQERLMAMRKNRNETDIQDILMRGVAGLPKELSLTVSVGVCVPRPCSTRQVFNSSALGVPPGALFTEQYCRLPDDKPWSPADTVAVIVFSLIGILNLVCTVFHVTYKFILKREEISSYVVAFSVYENGRRLVADGAGPNTLRCLDGIRVLATLWVVLGHCVVFQENYFNLGDMVTWFYSVDSWYATSAQFSVDTFFAISGMLLVYNTCLKTDAKGLLRRLPLFYMRRLWRLFPLLAATVLAQASLLHRAADGPLWASVARAADACRSGWWLTLLHLQNIFATNPCLGHSWYIAIDVHLHLISPVVLLWVVGGSSRAAYTALGGALLVTLAAATGFNYHYDFFLNFTPDPRALMKLEQYVRLYYINVVTRASPFLVGMVFGYLLYRRRGAPLAASKVVVWAWWCGATGACAAVLVCTHYTKQPGWQHQRMDNLLNSLLRPAWAAAVGWLVLACELGYGGPAGWALSVRAWRAPARLCYGVYLLHVPLMLVVAGTGATLDYFSQFRLWFMFAGYASVSFLASYVATVAVDAPLAAIFARALDRLTASAEKMKEPKQIVERL